MTPSLQKFLSYGSFLKEELETGNSPFTFSSNSNSAILQHFNENCMHWIQSELGRNGSVVLRSSFQPIPFFFFDSKRVAGMDQNLESLSFSKYDNNIKTPIRKTKTREKSNKCNQCDSAFSQAGNLRTHLKTHSGEKSNKCKVCDYASSQAGNLKRHLKIHSREKLNKCNQCEKAFSQAGHLRTHLKTHSGEKTNKFVQFMQPM